MPENSKSEKSLSEISHLFLSSVRERQTRGAPRPQRRAPELQPDITPTTLEAEADLTPEEIARVVEHPHPSAGESGNIAAILGSHLGARQIELALEYAAQIAQTAQRVGLIEIQAGALRVWTFEATADAGTNEAEATVQPLDGRRMTEVLHELAHDVEKWLVLVPSLRETESRSLLRKIPNWVLLMSCQEDGVVSAYRTLKGLRDIVGRNGSSTVLPRLSLGILDAHSGVEATRAYARLSGVTEQFLDWSIESQRTVATGAKALRHLILSCQGSHDKAQLAAAPQWQVLRDFIDHLKTEAGPVSRLAETRTALVSDSGENGDTTTFAAPQTSGDSRLAADTLKRRMRRGQLVPAHPMFSEPVTRSDAAARLVHEGTNDDANSDIVELPTKDISPGAIVQSVLRHKAELVECPIHPPMHSAASIAVSRDRRLVLVAVARQGLHDLHLIGQAYRWLIENRSLVGMALPQFAIDSHQHPQLLLLVDHADASADLLQPIVRSENVSVQSYRRLHWNGRTGLLLEAA